MKKRIIKNFDKIIVSLLGILGICNSCNPKVEYGAPHGEYELKGVITDKASSNPLKNIQIVRQKWDTVYTDAEGKYQFNRGWEEKETYYLKIEDIDGEENGGYFNSKELEVTFTKADQVKKGDGHWYEGKFSKTQNIELERIIPAPEYGVPQSTFKP